MVSRNSEPWTAVGKGINLTSVDPKQLVKIDMCSHRFLIAPCRQHLFCSWRRERRETRARRADPASSDKPSTVNCLGKNWNTCRLVPVTIKRYRSQGVPILMESWKFGALLKFLLTFGNFYGNFWGITPPKESQKTSGRLPKLKL